MFAIHSVGGTFDTHAGLRNYIKVLEWGDWSGMQFRSGSGTLAAIHQTLSWLNTDDDLRSVVLWRSRASHEWVPRLRALPTLEILTVDDQQVGPELRQLEDLSSLRMLNIHSASAGSLAHVAPLGQIEMLSLWRPMREPLGFESLRQHRGIRIVFFGQCLHAGEFVESLASLPALEEIQFQWSGGITTDQFEQMARMTRLNALIFSGTRVLDDAALEQLKRLPRLKTLYASKSIVSISDRGVEALAGMKELRELSFGVGDLTAAQVGELRRRMPLCQINVP